MVSVLDKHKRPLDPCSEKRARLLLERGRAVVHRIFPVFTIRLKDRLQDESVIHPLRIGIDPGSRTTGVSLSMTTENGERAKGLFELVHRGEKIHLNLVKRSALRRARRSRKTRYREARFDNRRRPEGWLPPSVRHRVESVRNLIRKLSKYFAIGKINVETARFDTQKLQNAEISGIEYQEGTLQGWDIREYVLYKFSHHCAYCGKTDVPFEIDHVIPKSKGGTDRVSNLVLSCHNCNQKKDDLSLEEFCPEKAELIREQLKAPLKDAAAMNAICYRIVEEIEQLGFPVTTSTGSMTKFNRKKFGVPKEHCLDALFSGGTRSISDWENLSVMTITCKGRGVRSRTLLNRFGFPRAILPRQKTFFGFQTGDICRAVVEKGKKAGEYFGRIAARSSGSFNIDTGEAVVQGISRKWLKLVQGNDGYMYRQTWRSGERNAVIPPLRERRGFLAEG